MLFRSPCGLDGLRGVRCAVRRCCAVARLRAVPPLVRFVVDARGGGCRGSAAYPKDSLPENRPVHETPAASPTRGNEIPIAFPEAVRLPSRVPYASSGVFARSEKPQGSCGNRARIRQGTGGRRARSARPTRLRRARFLRFRDGRPTVAMQGRGAMIGGGLREWAGEGQKAGRI